MKRPSTGRRLAALAASAMLVFAGAATAAADNLDVGDTITMGPLNVQMCAGEPTTAEATLRIRRVGGGNVYANSATVTFSPSGTPTGGLSASISINTITLPSNWVSLGNNTLSDPTTAIIHIPAKSASGSGTVSFAASGPNATSAGTVTRTAALTVNWTVQDCTPPNTPPTVNVTGVASGVSYEIGSVPAALCEVTDAEDGDSSFSATLSPIAGPFSEFGVGSQTASCAYTDGGGLTATASATYSIVDTQTPVITDLGAVSPPNGANGWYTSAVDNRFSVTDAGSGIPESFTNPWTVNSGTAEGSAVTVASGPVSDNVGNVADSINSGEFKIDLSDPTDIQFLGGPDASGSYAFGHVPAAPTCTADDAISGLASCDVSGYNTAIGTHTLTATATDNAGRTATDTRSYTVEAWNLDGFKRPVDKGIANTVKGGSTVPLKFEIFAGATELTSTDAVKTFKVTPVECGSVPNEEDEVEITTTGKTALRYDATEGQFIQNWQTPKSPGTCYVVTMTTQDGSKITASFKLK